MSLKNTPLRDFHIEMGARLVPFAGWEMPVQFTSIIEEHNAVRNQAGLFDVSHMGEARIKGSQAPAFMDYVMTNRYSNLKAGRARYTFMCQPDGNVVDDLIVYRIAEDEYMICLNASNTQKDVQWLSDHAKDFDCTVTDESLQWAQLALQGPSAMTILAQLAGDSIHELKRFGFVFTNVGSVESMVSRTGYAGEDGVEIYCATKDALGLTKKLLETGKDEGLLMVGLGARDSLRLEAGLPLYGHEISSEINPFEACLSWPVKLDKKCDFIGKAALQKVADEGTKRRLIFFIIEDRRIAREGCPIFSGEEKVGEVRSGTQSPILKKPIGSALVQSDANDDDLEAEIRGKRYKLHVKEGPLIRLARA